MREVNKRSWEALGITASLVMSATMAPAGPAARLIGSWGVDIQRLKEKNSEIMALPPAERIAIERDLGRLAVVFTEKTVAMKDPNGAETSSPFKIVSETDQLVVLELAQDGGGGERLRIRFTDDSHVEFVREGDDQALYLMKKRTP